MHEFSGPTVNNQACTYSSLGSLHYNGDIQRLTPMSVTVVPQLCPDTDMSSYPPRYDALSHGNRGNCGGYFTKKDAYPNQTCAGCKAPYVPRACDGNISCNPNAALRM
jgi:hypothetical protein